MLLRIWPLALLICTVSCSSIASGEAIKNKYPCATSAKTLLKTDAIVTQENPSLIKAKELYQKQVEKFKEMFHTTGYNKYEDFLKVVWAKKKNISPKLVDAIMGEEVEFSIAVKSSYRENIAEHGIKNRHETGTGAFGYRPEVRIGPETELMNLEDAFYRNLDNKIKPKYGYISPKAKSGLSRKYFSEYGGDIYIFKKKNIANRTTFTIGDSLDLDRKKHLGNWSATFIPWEFRGLAIPFLQRYSKKYKSFRIDGKVNTQIFDQLSLEGYKNSIDEKYLELQIWGPIDLGDVKEFIFTEGPPKGHFLDQLRKFGVKIFDGRDMPTDKHPPEWKGK